MIFAEYVEKEIETADVLSEGMFKKAMVRNGKKVIKWVSDRAGKYRIQFDKNGRPKEVRMTAAEKRKRSRAQNTKGKLKRKGKAKRTAYLRSRAYIVRKNSGLAHYDDKHPTQNPSRDSKLKKNTKKTANKITGSTSEDKDRGMK